LTYCSPPRRHRLLFMVSHHAPFPCFSPSRPPWAGCLTADFSSSVGPSGAPNVVQLVDLSAPPSHHWSHRASCRTALDLPLFDEPTHLEFPPSFVAIHPHALPYAQDPSRSHSLITSCMLECPPPMVRSALAPSSRLGVSLAETTCPTCAPCVGGTHREDLVHCWPLSAHR
jgi:hypothetical protein